MKKRGFTLMELLAVIVILAIIALIAVPIILNVIDETKKKAIKESANGYLDAVEKSIVLENLKEKNFNDGTYYIKNGDLYSDDTLETKVLDVKVKGDIPNGSDLNIEKGRITSCYLTISNYPVTCDANNISVGKKGEIPIKSFTVKENDINIDVDETKQLTAVFLPASATNKNVEWKSNDESIVTVDSKGIIKGIKKGTTSIVATASNGKKVTIEITIGKIYKPGDIVNVDTIYNLFEEKYKSDGVYTAKLSNEEEIDFEMYSIDGNKTYTETPTLCNSKADSVMCIYKYNGDLTIDSGVEIKPQVRKKGFVIYVEGTLTNNGKISMTARGANAAGQNVRLYKNSDSTYETVPAAGASGGTSVTSSSGTTSYNGKVGNNGTGRKTGGGGSGAAVSYSTSGTSGAGSAGTSYSGGTGGGGVNTGHSNIKAESGGANGGAGGSGAITLYRTADNSSFSSGGGAGNPGGNGKLSIKGGTIENNKARNGSDGTGGLLIIYTKSIMNNGSIESKGSNGGIYESWTAAPGGSSGGGSINIFYSSSITIGSIEVTGGLDVGVKANATAKGGAGGSGTKTICSIATGTCVK